MNFIYFIGWLFISLQSWARDGKPPATILCHFPKQAKELIGWNEDQLFVEQLCLDQKLRLEGCGYDVNVLVNAKPVQLDKEAKRVEKSKSPVVLSIGHGECFESDRVHHTVVTGESERSAVLTASLANRFKISNPRVTFISGSCASGGFCEDCRCWGANCSVGSVTGSDSLASFRPPAGPFGAMREYVMDEYVNLMCNPELFKKYANNCVMKEKEFEKYLRDTIGFEEFRYWTGAHLNELKVGDNGQVTVIPRAAGADSKFRDEVRSNEAKIRKSADFISTHSKLEIKTTYSYRIYCKNAVTIKLIESERSVRQGLSDFGYFPNLNEAKARFNQLIGSQKGCRLIESPTEVWAEFVVKEPSNPAEKPAFTPASNHPISFEKRYLGRKTEMVSGETSPESQPPPKGDENITLFDVDGKNVTGTSGSKKKQDLKAAGKMTMVPDYKSLHFMHPLCEQSKTALTRSKAGLGIRQDEIENKRSEDPVHKQ